MAGHPLRSATDHHLGGPLPHQPVNPTRAHPAPINLSAQGHATSCAYAVLTVVSNCYSPVQGRLPTCYSPILACVRHAASVHPEPGSNSLKDFIHGHRLKLTKKLVQIPFPFITVFGLFHSRNCKEFSSIMCFAVQLSMCSVFLTALIFYHSVLLSVKHFFDYFFKAFYWLYRRNFYIISFKITAVN